MSRDLVLTTISNLKSLYDDEAKLFWFIDEEMKNLHSNLSTIKAVLEDAEKRQLAYTSNALDGWLQKLNDAVYLLDDILDDCSIEAMRDEYEGNRSCSFLGYLHPQKVKFRHSISDRMKAIKKRLEFIAQEKERFHLQQEESHSNLLKRPKTISVILEDKIFGRQEDKENIVLQLLDGTNKCGDPLYVYPIIGMGGLGKTTLAKLVYNDKRVTNHFELKKWICVSDKFEMGTLIKGITGANESLDQQDVLVEKLKDMLRGKRYMIVFDDVWNEDPQRWLELRSLLLACESKNGVILVTTRLQRVASIMRTPDSVHQYELPALSDDECWEIIKKQAFGFSGIQETEDLVQIGMQIAKKCNGLPLAAKALGGVLCFKTNERSWRNVMNSDLWNLPECEDSLFAPLRLSYLNLPPRSRRCFSFCAIYPKDYEIEKEDLIYLWMANGLISKDADTELEVEDMGEEIVDDLYWRSLIQDIQRDDDDDSGGIRSFKMHDKVHDLAQYIMRHESYILEGRESRDLPPTTRQLCINYNEAGESSIVDLCSAKFESLRSLLMLGYRSPTSPDINLLKQDTLRAWRFPWYESLVLDSVGELKHLRYLNLSGSIGLRELPESIGSCWNLQILNLDNCVYCAALPTSIGRLKNLRHLMTKRCWLSSMPQNIGGLSLLRTLNLAVVGEKEKNEFQLSTLEHLKHLKGKLEIRCRGEEIDVKDAEKAKLKEKEDLFDLGITFRADAQVKTQILEALRPPPRLRRLMLFGYAGPSFPHWLMNEIASFTCIRSLCLFSCTMFTQLPPLWRLPSLKFLQLQSLPDLKYLVETGEIPYMREWFSFRSLENLQIIGLPRLEKIISGEEANQGMNSNDMTIFPRLSIFYAYDCPELNFFNLGALPSLQDMVLSNCEGMLCGDSFESGIFQRLNSLRRLSVERCKSKLKALPESVKYLSSLEELRIEDCEELEDIQSVILQLTSLRRLELESLDSLKSLDATDPELTDLPALKYLDLVSCPKLESLPNWMTYLVSLRELTVRQCDKLTCIPDGFELLPLKKLCISGCPELWRKCEKETGQDWHKIAHIPDIKIYYG